jgi:hypothetical protein
LLGPFALDEVDSRIAQASSGAYILSRDGKAAHYIGRSDTDLAARIKQSASEHPGNLYFWFETTTSAMQAYYLECEWWHKYNPPDNSNHPAVPPGTLWRCPVVGCEWS